MLTNQKKRAENVRWAAFLNRYQQYGDSYGRDLDNPRHRQNQTISAVTSFVQFPHTTMKMIATVL